MDLPRWLKAGRKLAKPPAGENVVITGMSGRFPESDDIYQFRDNLANKEDMVTYDTRRWEATHPEIPKRTGKIWNVEKFDAGFFGIHRHQADAIDPLCRILMEKAYECVLDAGLHPSELRQSRTGVFVGACASESEKYYLYDYLDSQAYAITGCLRSMLATRISYWMQLSGPAFVMDTACSSSFFAFEHAYRSIREGRCDRAIVAGTNLCLHPYVNLQFSRLGVLSMDGACKCFDDSANGYARSEAVCAVLLQKSKEAKRIYAEVIHSKVNADGYKEQGITYPSGDTQMNLIREVYEECQLDPTTISFMEAHGTGTKVGDPEELKAIEEIFVTNRTQPLLIGSVKSNIGHTEPTSGLCSVVKAILSMEGGKILPNTNFKTPRHGCKSLEDGRLQVVTENRDWPDDNGLVGINSFGFGGANCHTILKWNTKIKNIIVDQMPRLICISGRTPRALEAIFDDLKQRKLDPEFVRLFHDIYRFEIPDNNYRGFSIISNEGLLCTHHEYVPKNSKPLHLIFGPVLPIDFKELLCIPVFKTTIMNFNNILKPEGIDLYKVISNPTKQVLKTVVLQIAIFETLKDLGVVVDGFQGSSIGNISCAYSDGVISMQETVLITLGAIKYQKLENPLLQYTKMIIGAPRRPKAKWNLGRYLSAECMIELLTSNDKIEEEHSANSIYVSDLVGDGTFKCFLKSLGRLYMKGIELDLHKLYPPISWPVSRGTPMISPLIKWDHSRDWFVTKYRTQDILKTGHRLITVSLKDELWKYLGGHVIDGRNLFPATGYLTLAWEVLGMITGKMTTNMKIIFENVKFLRATTIPQKGNLQLTVMVQRGTGNFEVIEGNTAVVTGRVYEDELTDQWSDLPLPQTNKAELELTQKDIYKELRLRGYNYKGQFKALKSCDVAASSGIIEWNGNWVTFLDNLLQMQILQQDSRNLYVPTVIKRMMIDSNQHLELTENNAHVPVYSWKNADVLRSGAVEIRGLYASSIARRKTPDPVLETYCFVPNNATLDFETSVRINLQIVLENISQIKFKIVECMGETNEPMVVELKRALSEQPLIEADLHLLTSQNIEIPGVTVEDKQLHAEQDCHLLIMDRFSARKELHHDVPSLKPNGFIITYEAADFNEKFGNYLIITRHQVDGNQIILLKKIDIITKCTAIKIGTDLNWLSKLQEALKLDQRVFLHSPNLDSGILGLVNCLRREMSGDKIRCFFMRSDAPVFEPTHVFYQQQIEKNCAFNVFDQEWGTFRHVKMEQSKKCTPEHCYVNVVVRGDLSSLSWIEGPLKQGMTLNSDEEIVEVHYGSINFRDVMTASGRVTVDAISKNRLEQECVQGFEFAGLDSRGRRVMGMINSGALATMIAADKQLFIEVPSSWSLEDAATVPVVYSTVLYAFFMRATGLKKGHSILIHSGTGGVGQAAINIAIHYGCRIFTTVGTEEKRDYIIKNFPFINPADIGCSRDTTFEEMVMKRTLGRGVDLVLNSLSDDKLQASVRCLAHGGYFLEIGKFDLSSDSALSTDLAAKGCAFHGIMLDGLFVKDSKFKQPLMILLNNAITSGAAKPLVRTCFESHQLESAFRFMATGKHIGKVIIKIRGDEPPNSIEAIPRYYCPRNYVCVIIGGLGGFGLELADWLVLRGCRHLVLTSRNVIRTGYQLSRINTWKSYGAIVEVVKDDLNSQDAVMNFIKGVSELGTINAIFNLAVVLNDCLFENQSVESFTESLAPKANLVRFLDAASRELCPDLEHFVVFSSVSCGRGNAGQSNYGFSNSIMERICERRKADGFPALAIQWGAIGDVGLVAELQEDSTERAIGGTLQQRMASCLEVLDKVMKQEEPVVASMLVAEKRSGEFGAENMVDAVVNILGLRDLKTVSLHSTLAELGMDSMMAVEIKQTLEREYEVFLTPHDIRVLSFARLQQLAAEKDIENAIKTQPVEKPQQEGVQFLLRFIDDEECSKTPVVKLPNLAQEGSPKVFVFPGVEGFASIMAPLCAKLTMDTICLQFCYENPRDTLQDMARDILPHVIQHLRKGDTFNFLAYSYGCTIAVELAFLLEELGYSGELVLIDGAHEMMLRLTHQQIDVSTPATFETSLLCTIFTIYVPLEIVNMYKKDLLLLDSYEARVNFVQSKSPETRYSREYIKKVCIAFHKRVSAVVRYEPNPTKLKSRITLLRPTRGSVIDIAEDYLLSCFTQEAVAVKFFEDDHYTILESNLVATEINNMFKKVHHKESSFNADYNPPKQSVM